MKKIKAIIGALAVLVGLQSVASWAASDVQADGQKLEVKPRGGKTGRSGPPCGGGIR